MKYTDFILTVIALLLALHLVKPWLSPEEARAGSDEIVNVNILKVGGERINRSVYSTSQGVPVYLVK
jgi:hypothetical protein